MDELVKKIAGLGFPGIILIAVMASTGLTGAAAITAALAFLGGPAGMLGGIAVLGLTGLIADALTNVGLEELLTAVYCQRIPTRTNKKNCWFTYFGIRLHLPNTLMIYLATLTAWQ